MSGSARIYAPRGEFFFFLFFSFLDKGYINIRPLHPRMYTANYYNVWDKRKRKSKPWSLTRKLKQTVNMFPSFIRNLQSNCLQSLACRCEDVLGLLITLLLVDVRMSLACSSRCSGAQKRSQYAPLKITCIMELVLSLLNITSFRHRQMAQHMAATPTKITPLSLLY